MKRKRYLDNSNIKRKIHDVRFTDISLTLRQLLPMKWYKTIFEDIELSVLCKSSNGKQYVYCEQPDRHYGFKSLVACITDGRIVETCGYSEKEAKEIIEEIMNYKNELDEHISTNELDIC